MRKAYMLLLIVLISAFVRAQNGEIAGIVKDETGEGAIGATIQLVDNAGKPTGKGTVTDYDGKYSLKPLNPGTYNVKFSLVGKASIVEKGVVVYSDKTTFLDKDMVQQSKDLNEVVFVDYKVKLIGDKPKGNVSAAEIAKWPTKNVTDLAATTSGVFQSDNNKGISIRGSRENSVEYYVDGVKVRGVPTLPTTSIQELSVTTGGVPARFGDATGGIVNIVTKGPADELTGGVEVQTSQFLDAYGFNLFNANLSGPLWKTKKKNPKDEQRTLLGFALSGEYLYQKDPNPSAVGVWAVRPEVMDSMQRFPLVKQETTDGVTFFRRSDGVSFKDMYKTAVKPNTAENNYRAVARIEFKPISAINIGIGGSFSYRTYHDWIDRYTLLNYENNPLRKDLNWRIFGRVTHNLQSAKTATEDKDGKKKTSAFQNAFYTLQFDYEKYSRRYEDETHGFNTFNYGYIGKFKALRSNVFSSEYQTISYGGREYTATTLIDVADTAIQFTPGTLNPFGTAFTTQYYQELGGVNVGNNTWQVFGELNNSFTRNIRQIETFGALINGQRSQLVNQIWFNTGRQFNGYGYDDDNDQYRVRLDGSFDIQPPGKTELNRHSIEFGFEYEQRIERFYRASPLSMWLRAELLANRHIANLDTVPILLIDGVQYAVDDPNRPDFYQEDTILFNRQFVPELQSEFDKNLRRKLGLDVNGSDLINVYDIDPSMLSLDMFSPNELIDVGLVDYRGYDAYGNRLTSQPSFNDFFTRRNAQGIYERPVGAYSPIYVAAYIQDRFNLKGLSFNVGLRFERFDANQKVLRDRYSLYSSYTAGEVAGNRPSNIGDDYYVYVNDPRLSNPTVTGYRSGDRWFDANGVEKASANALLSEVGTVVPYLKNSATFDNKSFIQDSTFNPDESFMDYKPRLMVLPRLSFGFKITDKARFFAHYDVLAQRPQGRNLMDPKDYFYFAFNEGGTINNPDLKPERSIDLEFGFEQQLGSSSAVSISAYYREFRDMIQIRRLFNAYPYNYTTWDNIDFGTTKGFSLDYDLRRTGNVRLTANYTLQFAEGTGSDDASQLSIVNANAPNFRSIFPLNYDARHTINLNFDFGFDGGKKYNGPVVRGKQILADAGISFILRARSGTPYTAQSNVTPEGLEGQVLRPITEGGINSSRVGWNFNLGMRIYKSFVIHTGGKKGKDGSVSDKGRDLSFQVYMQFQNLLGLQNPISVYRYTGNTNDDGFLGDPASLPRIAQAFSPQGFKDQYSAYINRPENYSLPRRIFLGVQFNF